MENTFEPKSYIDCIDAYKEVENPEEWMECPKCGLKPKIWEFDNGRSTACGCGESPYNHFCVKAKDIVTVMKESESGYNATKYDTDELRKNWNDYCANSTPTHN